MNIAVALIGTFALAFALTALLMPPVMQLCERRGWVAQPGGRRLHARPTPTIGGIAIFGGFALALLATFFLAPLAGLLRSPFEQLRLALLLAGTTIILVVMWVDDVRELPPTPKLLGQLAAALVAVGPFLWDQRLYPDALGAPTEARGVILTAFNFPFVQQINLYNLSPWLAVGATLFWIVAMNNTINFLDGLDGLAGSISLIAALALGLHAALQQDPPQYTVALLPLALAGACAGFLVFNLPPARVFMGDAGAHVLGYVLSLSAIIGGAKLATVLLVLGVPILDVAWLIVSRSRGGRSPAQSGRDHLHHRLLDMGFSARQIVAFYATLSASFGLLGISGASREVKLVALGLLGLIVVVVLVYVTRRSAIGGERRT